MESSLYIHIPFCRRKCIYCNFYSDIYNDTLAASYINVLINHVDSLTGRYPTIYIGGGTPSALHTGLFRNLLKSLSRLAANASEFTVEANPESLTEEKIKLLLDSGVNRLSVGIQSLDDRKLKKLGRIHDSKRAKDSVNLASKKGFKNISVDLIFGVWGEGTEAWERELGEVIELPITHVSCYELTYEKGTPLFISVKNKSLSPLDDKIVAEMYETAIDILSVHGFKQYEVSNFSIGGCGCRHNLNYWENNPYVGLGPSAFSYDGETRVKYIADTREYIRRAEEGRPLVGFSERLKPIRRARETASIKIRTKDGIDFSWFKDHTGYDFLELEKKAIEGLLKDGLIKYKKEDNIPTGIALKRKGFLFCDTVSSALL